MRTGFQQQDTMTNFVIPKSCPVPQHGQQPDKACKQIKDRRVLEPRPGH